MKRIENLINEKKEKKKGYSLLESIIALGILLLGIIPILTLTTRSILFHYNASQVEELVRLSETIVDYISSKGYKKLVYLEKRETLEDGVLYNLVPLDKKNGLFTIDKFGEDFGISQDFLMFASKGVNLDEVKIKVTLRIDKTASKIKTLYEIENSYINYLPYKDNNDIFNESFLFGEVTIIHNLGDKTNTYGKEREGKKEYKTTFFITPTQN